jgi:hypothetical protein
MATSATLATRPDFTVFTPLRQRLRTWRATRVRGERIPEELWNAAAALARVHGLSATATALKLSYYHLQDRLLSARSGGRGGAVQATFVELPAAATARPPCEAGTVELVRTSGARLTLRLPHAQPRDFLPLVELLLREGW